MRAMSARETSDWAALIMAQTKIVQTQHKKALQYTIIERTSLQARAISRSAGDLLLDTI